ncbi:MULTISPECIES: type IV secretion system protein [unclassified Halomonas]|uniref:type IV secretion system protein n=1 Tax=unclassified Halomonas TaxID=2609666 RepID=UPI002883FCDE|nr:MULTISPECIES: type IV secretion system protein [unclassified Halomonas]MDT0502342.1 type IV secretion system protein [Halomonas sp. PAR7]MDT0511721.1 type IV secretion system protein [Halomonas sp. LES1]MDT0592054.1 type IV secretion system protein [Halomonas sp. PAR8]
MNLFEGMFSVVDQALDQYIVNTATDLIAYITPMFTSMLIVWVAIWGYLMMFGKVSEPLQEGVFRILRIGFIMTLGLTVGTYMGVVVDVLAHGPVKVAAVITGSNGGAATILDSLFSRVLAVADQAWDKAGVMSGDFGMYLVAILIMVFGGGVAIVVAFLLLASKVATTVLLAIGPFFITGLLFNSTQRFFESWLGMVVNFGMLLVLGSAIGRMVIDVSEAFMNIVESSAGTMASMTTSAYLIAFFALGILVLKQVPAIASALGGGVALATQGALGSAMSAMRPSTIRRQYRGIQRDTRIVGNAAAAPYRGAKSAYRAYQKRFGAGNVITGG